MKYTIDKEKRPVYLQLYQQIRDDIISENYPYSTKLPSKRSLAEETGVSVITVEHAYALLCDEGYVESRARSGFVVIFRKTDGFASASDPRPAQTKQPTEHTYPDFPLSVLSKTMRKVLTENGDLLLEKSPNSGCIELRRAIRLYLARNRGIKVDVDQIIIGSGSEYLYGLIIELLGRHQIYAIESPSYKQIEQVYRAAEI
ncbi:MAG: GntR family transcriptional regulator, partial [Clostridia bacterium]|nr:GntR family transcriptional regulator [Clostridia bacterium]